VLGGQDRHDEQPYSQNSDDNTTNRHLGNALEPDELMPINGDQARLVVRGTLGRMVNLMEWTDFVKYLDELCAARRRRQLKLRPTGFDSRTPSSMRKS
jgi:hypothetical protein